MEPGTAAVVCRRRWVYVGAVSKTVAIGDGPQLHIPSNIYLPTYLPIYLPIYLPTYLPIYLSTFLPIYLPTYLSIYLSTYIDTKM